MSVRTSANTAWIRPRGIPTSALTSSNPARWAFYICGITLLLFNLSFFLIVDASIHIQYVDIKLCVCCRWGTSVTPASREKCALKLRTWSTRRPPSWPGMVCTSLLVYNEPYDGLKTRGVWSVWYFCCDHRCWNVTTTCFHPRLLSTWQAVAR